MSEEQMLSPQREGLLQRLAGYVDWRANPVLVKDLRLWMRGKLFIVMYFLLVLLVVIGSGLYTFLARQGDFSGRALWGILFGVVLAVCGAIIPNMIYERFRSELKNRATELALLSELTAGRIVRGKLLSAWCGSLLVMSAAAPAFSTAYLLGGIDFRTAVFFIAWMIWAAVTMPTIQLMLATLGTHVGFRLFSIIAFLAQFVGAIVAASSFFFAFLMNNSLQNDTPLLIASGFIFFGGLAQAYFFYHVAISRLRGDNEDREFAPRFLLSLIALLTALAVVITAASTSSVGTSEMMNAAANTVAWIFGFGFLFITRTTDHLPVRLALNWPAVGVGRLLFYPGNRRLCAFMLANYLVVFLLLALSILFQKSGDRLHQGIGWALVPFLILGVGLVAHDVLVVPFCARRGWRPSAIISIVGANILLGLLGAVLGVLSYIDRSLGDVYQYVLCISPVGYVCQLFNTDGSFVTGSVLVLIIEALLLSAFLFVIALFAWGEGRRHFVGGSGKYSISSSDDHAD